MLCVVESRSFPTLQIAADVPISNLHSNITLKDTKHDKTPTFNRIPTLRQHHHLTNIGTPALENYDMANDHPNHSNLNQPFSGHTDSSLSMSQHINNTQTVPKFENEHQNPQGQQKYPQDQQQHQFGATDAQPQSSAAFQAHLVMHQPPQPMLQQPAATRPPSAFNDLPPGWENDSFWTIKAKLRVDGGVPVRGTFAQLYVYYAVAHEEIWRQHHAYWLSVEAQRTPQAQRHGQIAHYHTPDVAQPANPLFTAPTAPPKQKKRPHKTDAAVAKNPVPPYGPDADLDTPAKCRDYLAYVDPADVHVLTFENDDWQHVLRNRKHEFIGGIFEALTHQYAQDTPDGVVLGEKALERYYEQQDAQMAKVVAQLQTNSQIKTAKALCSLLFDAVVYIHEVGVSTNVWEGYQWYAAKDRQVDRKYRLDVASICSVRLGKLVNAVQSNKLIAMDVLDQTNFDRMARDPLFYLLEKFTYLRSNKTRQENIERHNKQEKVNANFEEEMKTSSSEQVPRRGGKRKRLVIVEESESESEEDDQQTDEGYGDSDGNEFERSFKRMRA